MSLRTGLAGLSLAIIISPAWAPTPASAACASFNSNAPSCKIWMVQEDDKCWLCTMKTPPTCEKGEQVECLNTSAKMPNMFPLDFGGTRNGVVGAQEVLAKKGYDVKVNGVMDNNYREAVKAFQTKEGLNKIDGKIGPETLGRLVK